MKHTIATLTITAAALAFSPIQAIAEDGLVQEQGATEASAGKAKINKRKAPPQSRSEAISRTQERLKKLETMSDDEWKEKAEKRQEKRALRKERRQDRRQQRQDAKAE